MVSGPSRGRQVSIRTLALYAVLEESQFPAPLEVDRYLYIVFYNYTYELDILFPAPPEVDRQLYTRLENKARFDKKFPAPREVDRELYTPVYLPYYDFYQFPAPLEVHRYLYVKVRSLIWQPLMGFRPLSRQIGSYTEKLEKNGYIDKEFPAPREVDREIYFDEMAFIDEGVRTFPAPREVDRYLYFTVTRSRKRSGICFRPLSRQIGRYTMFVSISP